MNETRYTFVLDDPERERYRRMAAEAEHAEETLWELAGITSGARVLDLGCGPGAFLETLAQRVAPDGEVVAVDQDATSLGVARAHAPAEVELHEARAEQTGLDPGSFDAVFMRHVLIHNTPRSDALLRHVASLLGAGGRLLSAEVDARALEFPPEFTPEERELEDRWLELMARDGNDSSTGKRLEEIVSAAGFRVVCSAGRLDPIRVERSPTWTAATSLVEAGLASAADVERWAAAIERRLADTGPLRVGVPVYVVVAEPV